MAKYRVVRVHLFRPDESICEELFSEDFHVDASIIEEMGGLSSEMLNYPPIEEWLRLKGFSEEDDIQLEFAD